MKEESTFLDQFAPHFSKINEELGDAAKAIDTLGGKLREVKEIELEALPGKRCLVIIDKVHPTPDIYPRRPGIPAKHPIS